MRDRLQTESNNLMMVGHLLYLSRLVAMLLGVRKDHAVVEFRRGGVVQLDRNESGAWVVRWAITPGTVARADGTSAARCLKSLGESESRRQEPLAIAGASPLLHDGAQDGWLVDAADRPICQMQQKA